MLSRRVLFSAPALLATCLSLSLAGCADGGDADAEFLGCKAGKCDSEGPIRLARAYAAPGTPFRAVAEDGVLITVDPTLATLTDLGDGRYEITANEPGFLELTASGAAVDRRLVRIGTQGPSLTLTPAQGGMVVTASKSTPLALTGSVTDPLGGTVRLSLGADEIPLAADGSFAAQPLAGFGIRQLPFFVTDQAGNRFRLDRAVIVAPAYGGEEARNAIRLSNDALAVLAAELSPLLPSLTQQAARSEYVGEEGPLSVYFDGATLPGQSSNPGSMRVQIRGIRGGLRVSFSTQGNVVAKIHTVGPLATRHGRVHIRNIALQFDLVFVNTYAGVTSSATNVSLSDSGISIVGLGGIIDRIANGNTAKIRQKILSRLTKELPAVLHTALRTVERRVTLPSGPSIDYAMKNIWPDDGGVTIGLNGKVVGAGRAPRTGTIDIASIPAKRNAGVALHYDLINQLLYTQHAAGAFARTLDLAQVNELIAEKSGLGALAPRVSVKVAPALPPIISAGADRKPRLSMGEVTLHFDLNIAGVTLRQSVIVGFQADVGGSVQNGKASLALGEITTWIDFSGEPPPGPFSEVIEAVIDALIPRLADTLAQKVQDIPVPTFDLSKVGLAGRTLVLSEADLLGDPDGFKVSGQVLLYRR